METLSQTRYLGQKIIRAFGLVPTSEQPNLGERIACSFTDHTLEVRIPAWRTDPTQAVLFLHFIVRFDERLVAWVHLGEHGAIDEGGWFPEFARGPLVKLNNVMDGYLPYALYGDVHFKRRDEMISWLTAPARSSDNPAPARDPSR